MVRGRRTRMVATQTPMDDLCCLSPKRKNFKVCHSSNASGTQSTMFTKRSARIANSLAKRDTRQAITNFFQVQTKMMPNGDNEPNPSIQDDDDNACDHFGTAFGHHFNAMIDEPFNLKDNVTNRGVGLGTDDDGDSSNSNSSVEPNIFLQKPVLHLNIDKSPNQASSIVINKHLQISPNFVNTLKTVTTKKITANHSIMSNGSNKNHKTKRRKTKLAAGCIIDVLTSSDSNSCDSGVVADKNPEPNTVSMGTGKPTTPHRIVCTASTAPAKQPQHYTEFNVDHSDDNNGNGETTPFVQNDYKSKRRLLEDDMDSESSHPIVAIGKMTEKEINEIVGDNSKLNESENITARSCSPIVVKKAPAKQLTDFFPVRRSVRKTKRAVEQENLRHIERAIERQTEDGLLVKLFKDKGRGIIAGRPFSRGEFVIEYIGDLIDQAEADRREKIYAKDAKLGCYMYYFKHKEHHWCIDATAETGFLGRLVNHSRNGNLTTKIVMYKGRPHLVLLAKENIKEGEELTYDYGDRTRESLVNHPWLAL